VDAQVDLYAALGLTKECSAAELKKTYRKLALQLHPDKNPGNKQAEAHFQEVRARRCCPLTGLDTSD